MTLDPRQLDPEGLHAQTRSLRALARALVGDGHEADDVVQEAWLTSLGRPPRRGWSLASWLSGITRNQARQRAREQQRRTRREHVAARPELQPPDDSIERIDMLRHLLDQVRGLDEPYRSTILLRFFDGLSPKEVARRQSVPPATVRTRLHRGIEILRRRMDETTEGGRQAWLAPLAPFVSVPDPGPTTTPVEGTSRLVQTTSQGMLAMSAKTKVVGVAIVLGAGLLTVTLSPLFSDPGVEGPDTGRPPSVSARNADPDPGALEGRPSMAAGREVIALEKTRTRDKDSNKDSNKDSTELLRLLVEGVVRSDKGVPLAGAVVSTGKQKTTTGEDGRYALQGRVYDDKSKHKIAIRASSRGHCSVSRSVLVSSDSSPVHIDFTLGRGFLVTGRVTTSEGEGIANAWVRMYPYGAQAVRTDDQGVFRVDDIDPSTPKHYLEASAKGYLPTGKSIEVAGKRAEQDLLLVLKRGSVVRGVVYGPHRQPVPGAKVSMPAGKLAEVHVVSDERGAFELTGARPGRQALTIRHKEYAAAIREIDVPPTGNDLEVVINLFQGETLSGVVRDSRGAPIAGAWISIGSKRAGVRKAITDERGAFDARGLPAGDLNLRCGAAGYLTRHEKVRAGRRDTVLTLQRSARIAGRVVDAQTNEPVTEFTVRFVAPTERGKDGKDRKGWSFKDPEGRWEIDGVPSGFVTGLEIRAEGRAPAVVPRVAARVDARHEDLCIRLDAGTTLEGLVVVNTTSKPVPGATVKIVRAHDPLDLDSYKDSGRQVTRCDAEGRFELANVGCGDLHLAVEHMDWGLVLHPLNIPPGTPRMGVTVRVDSQGTLVGVVREADGRPVSQARVNLSVVRVPGLVRRTWRTRADAQGRFVFRSLPEGIYRLGHWKGGKGARKGRKSSETLARYVRIAGSKRHEVVLNAAAGATVRGKVIAPGEMPSYLYVALTPQYPEETPWEDRQPPQWTMATGETFTFEGLQPGHYHIDVYSKAGSPMHGRVEVDVSGADEQRAEVLLTPRDTR